MAILAGGVGIFWEAGLLDGCLGSAGVSAWTDWKAGGSTVAAGHADSLDIEGEQRAAEVETVMSSMPTSGSGEGDMGEGGGDSEGGGGRRRGKSGSG